MSGILLPAKCGFLTVLLPFCQPCAERFCHHCPSTLVNGSLLLGSRCASPGTTFEAIRVSPTKMCLVPTERFRTVQNWLMYAVSPCLPRFTTRSPLSSHTKAVL